MHRIVRAVWRALWRHKRAAEAGYLLLAHRVECLSVRIARPATDSCGINTFSLLSLYTPMTFLANKGQQKVLF